MSQAKSHAKIGAVLLLGIAAPLAVWAQSAPQPAPGGERSELRQKYREACGGDVQKFCANIERAKGALRSCLQSHESELSAACKAARAERAAARAKDKG